MPAITHVNETNLKYETVKPLSGKFQGSKLPGEREIPNKFMKEI